MGSRIQVGFVWTWVTLTSDGLPRQIKSACPGFNRGHRYSSCLIQVADTIMFIIEEIIFNVSLGTSGYSGFFEFWPDWLEGLGG